MSEFTSESLMAKSHEQDGAGTPNPVELPLADDDQVEQNHNEEKSGVEASSENVAPMQKLKLGLWAAMGFAAATAQKAIVKAEETYQSEAVQNFKARTVETVDKGIAAAGPALERARTASIPYYEKAVEAGTPVWEKTVEVSQSAYTKSIEVAETMKPAAEKVIENIRPSADKAIENMKPVIEKVNAAIATGAEKFIHMTGLDNTSGREPYAPSAMDSATKGGAMNV
eukprot:gene6517-13172_t